MLFSQEIILFHIFSSELCCLQQGMDVVYAFYLFFIALPFNGIAWKISTFILNGIEEKPIILCSPYTGDRFFYLNRFFYLKIKYYIVCLKQLYKGIFIIAFIVFDRETFALKYNTRFRFSEFTPKESKEDEGMS